MNALVLGVLVSPTLGLTAVIEIQTSGITFTPSTVNILVGDTIRWQNISGGHTTTNGTGSNDPNAGILWDATLNFITPVFERQFTTVGTFPFFCRPHEFSGMTGTIEVVMPTGVRDDQTEEAIPPSAVLYQNFPNPFNAATQIRYDLSNETHVCLTILDMLGHPVRTLINERLTPGLYWSIWDGLTDDGDILASGMYLYRLRVDNAVESKKMIFLK